MVEFISVNVGRVVHVKIKNLVHLIEFIFLDTDLPVRMSELCAWFH